ncbi:MULTISPECIES: hypothetical protein [Streptomyces]|uniref:Uncharacterized protein n=1 Tax=Streptomyces xanthochromogenes TaxID=67384 RepID=A0ABQ2ZDU6_9ACTN|nr:MULTISPECIES: hypothetical protein [Streptomyces]MYV92288.1 hypothetical protein [Streptomyces sp. SID1034]GGY13725.1 hypothetical protein GCM10010326_01290 [Streptomyces xanthochromogenes]
MSRLPGPYRWISKLSESARLLEQGAVPVLRPAETERAERWARILHTYPEPTLCPTPPPGARVVSLAGHEDAGEVAAHALGRPHHVLAPEALHDPDALGPHGGSVLIVARARALTLSVLMPLLAALARQNTLAGVLTGRDDAALTFATAKLLAPHRAKAAPARTGLLDGTTGLTHILTAGHPDRRSTLDEVLSHAWDSLLVDADGSAAHASLGSVTLCGLSGPSEHGPDGTPLNGGCTPTACKTDPSRRTRSVAPHDLHTHVLCLFVCNAITLGEEQYPSDVSLALDAIEGHPQGVLGLIRGDLSTSGHEPRLTAALLHSGARLGQIVAHLDADGRHRGIRGPSTILLGDPEHRPYAPDSAITLPAAVAPATSRPRLDISTLTRWRNRLNDAEALEYGLRASLDRRPDADLSACLQEMASHRQAALDTLLTAVRTPDEAWEDRIEEHSLSWGHSVLSILSRTRGGAFSRQLLASRAHHHTAHWSPAPACGYCRAPREYEHLTSPLGLTGRRTLRCPKCGPALSLPPTLLALDVGVPPALLPGQPADVHVTVPDRARGLLAVHLRPRSTRRGSYDHAVLAATPGRHTVTLTVPEEPLPELDRLWAVHADRFHLAYHQHRVPLLPHQGDTVPHP